MGGGRYTLAGQRATIHPERLSGKGKRAATHPKVPVAVLPERRKGQGPHLPKNANSGNPSAKGKRLRLLQSANSGTSGKDKYRNPYKKCKSGNPSGKGKGKYHDNFHKINKRSNPSGISQLL